MRRASQRELWSTSVLCAMPPADGRAGNARRLTAIGEHGELSGDM
jgi:hypothetical protein